MIPRQLQPQVFASLATNPAVALLGPRQVGKTTLALAIGQTRPSLYLDLESQADRARLTDAESYLAGHADKLVILDEVHRAPEIFQTLRVAIDRGRRAGKPAGQFLLLGSASVDLLRQSGESLAGRIAYLELCPLDAGEIARQDAAKLWSRGGFPTSFLAETDPISFRWRQDFIRTYLERDIPQFAPRLPAETLRRLWTMLAHNQGELVNAATLARSLAVDAKTIARYVDLLVDLFLVRRLQPWHANEGKRLVKSPKLYVRDSGLVHALLRLPTRDDILSHPVAGGSWEGFVIESILAACPPGTEPNFYRTAAGAEIDLLLSVPGAGLWAIEIKTGTAPKLERGFHQACDDLQPARKYVVYNGTERFSLGPDTQAIPVFDLVSELKRLG